ncbi:MAG: YciI family protein [Pseudomonadota bacterium]
MRYTFLTYSRPEDFANVPPEELGQLKGLFGAYIGSLKEAGILVGVDWLQPVSNATTVSDGGNRIQDGPFAETKEMLGGYMTIEVPDLDTAIAWAKKCPMAKYGAVEIRPTAMDA